MSELNDSAFNPLRFVVSELDGKPREVRIAEWAYFRAQSRGFAPGHEVEDWLEAEDVFDRSMTRPQPPPRDGLDYMPTAELETVPPRKRPDGTLKETSYVTTRGIRKG